MNDERIVLVVEDDDLTRRSIDRLLCSNDWFVYQAKSVSTARLAMRCLKATNRTLVAVISDYDLPDGTAEDVFEATGKPENFILHSGRTDVPKLGIVVPKSRSRDLPDLIERLVSG